MASNDPRRKNRSGNPARQGSDGAQAAPAIPGQQPVSRQAQQIGQAVTEGMAQLILGALPQILVQALGEAQIRTVPLQCSTCTLNRLKWTVRHEGELKAAYGRFAAALAELPEDDPRRGMINPLAFLPDELKPSQDPLNPNPAGYPGIDAGTCMVAGTLFCPAHMPGAPDQASSKQILIATGSLNPTMIAQVRAGML